LNAFNIYHSIFSVEEACNYCIQNKQTFYAHWLWVWFNLKKMLFLFFIV